MAAPDYRIRAEREADELITEHASAADRASIERLARDVEAHRSEADPLFKAALIAELQARAARLPR